MSVERTSKLKMRPSVAVVVKDTFTEFFLSDIRKSVVLQMQKEVANKIRQLDGKGRWQNGWRSMILVRIRKVMSFLY